MPATRSHAQSHGQLPPAPEADPFFDDLLALAANLGDVPVALLISPEQTHCRIRGNCQFPAAELKREIAFCSRSTARSDGLMVVPDAAANRMLGDDPCVQGEPWIRFYATAPLITPDGQHLGALHLIDYSSRQMNAGQRSAFACLARQAAAQLELRRHAHELAQSARDADRFRTLVETAPGGFVLMDVTGKATYATTSITRLMGYEMNEVIGRNMFSLIHPDDLRTPFEIFAELICTPGAKGTSEFRCLQKDGSWKWMEAVAQNFLEVPSVQAVACSLWDISGRKAAEAALRESEARSRRIMDSNVVGIFFWKPDGTISDANDRFLEMVGYTRQDLAAGHMNWTAMTPPEFASSDQLAREQIAVAGVCAPYEKEYIRKDRSRLPIYTGAATLEGLREDGVCFVIDIMDRKRVEGELVRKRNLFRAILDNLPLCIYGVDRELRFILNNRAHLRLLGLNGHEEVAQKAFVEVATPELASAEARDIRSVLETGTPVLDRESMVIDSNGNRRVHLASKVPLLDGNGKVVGVIGISQDVTERQQAQEQIQKLAAFPQFNPNPVFEFSAAGELTYCNAAAHTLTASLGQTQPEDILPPLVGDVVKKALQSGRPTLRLETPFAGRTISWSFFPIAVSRVVHCYAVDTTERLALESQLRQVQKMESIGQLAGGVAHDFNNILTVIQGHAALLLDATLPAEQAESAQQIEESAQRAANLTRQLLTFSRRQVLQPRNLDLNDVVCTVTRMLKRILGEDVALNVRYASNLPPIHADRGMIEQVLLNLAVNSRDAMPRGGRLDISLKTVVFDEAAARNVVDARPGHFVVLSVRDTGCGIAAENLGRIFEPFFTTKNVGHGTGLGLATVYGVVQQHEGWIHVESQVGHGTHFEIYLPVSAQPTRAPLPIAERKPRGGSECILLVEDEEPLRELIRCILEDHGYTVLEARSGPCAFDVWRQHAPRVDMLLTDIVMPGGLTGCDLADALKQQKPNLRVLFSSGYSSDTIGKDFILSEGVNFLKKPYHPMTLAETVRDCLDR